MTKDRKLDLALEALEKISKTRYHIETPPVESLEEKMRSIADRAITAIKQALAAPVQEPVAWVCYGAPGKRDIDFEESDINGLPIGTFLYTTPPAAQRQWVGLEPKDMTALIEQARQVPKEVPCPDYNERLLTLADAKLREKNAT